MKKLRVISSISFVFVLVVVTVQIANKAWFSLSKPAGADSCNYSGTWESAGGQLIGGRILAKLPVPPPVGRPFAVKVYVYYNITSLYGLGSFMPVDMEGFIEESGTTSGESSESPVTPPRITFKSKASGNSGQTIEYVSSANASFSRFVGGYRSASPRDAGTFSIKAIR